MWAGMKMCPPASTALASLARRLPTGWRHCGRPSRYGASADAACMGRTSSGKLSSSIWSWSGSGIRPTLGAPRLRSFTTSPCLGRRLLLSGALLLGLLDGLAQGLHEVHHLRGLWRRGRFDDLAFDLGLHDLHHRLAVVVLVAARVEGVGQALDQRLRHL